MRTAATTVVALGLTACSGRSPAPEYPTPEPLPAMSVQRQLEQRANWQGTPGTMDPFAESTTRALEDAQAQREAIAFQKQQDVQLKRFVLAEHVKAREPVNAADSFDAGERVYAFLHLADVKDPYELAVQWEAVDGDMPPVTKHLSVKPSPRYRTWTWTRAPEEPGTYRCVVRTAGGQEVAEKWFDVSP